MTNDIQQKAKLSNAASYSAIDSDCMWNSTGLGQVA